jgi:methyl-accepting chemotaxis protein
MAPIKELRSKFGIALIIVALGVFPIGYFAANRIVNPIKAMMEQAKQVAGGDLRQYDWQYSSQDELGELATAFAGMVTNLRELVQNLAQCAEQLAASSEQLTAVTDESATATNQVAGLVGEVAQGAGKQAEAVASITAKVEQVATRVRLVATNADQASAMSGKTAEVAQGGNDTIAQAVQQMSNIEETVNSSAEVVAKLGERSKDIGQIVDTIANIAGQTNLLALNAAIEAARAGEQGKGFAVVAEEVRKLAEQSEAAAKQIATLIREIQGDTDLAVVAMNTGTQEVVKGKTIVTTAGENFREITVSVDAVLRQVSEISTAMGNIENGSDEIVKGIFKIDTISKATAEHTQTVSAATEEQSASLEEIAASCQGLAKMAQGLQNIIGKFQL